MSNNYYIGVDLGGTKILTALADENGKIITRNKRATEADRGAGVIIENINKTILAVVENSGIDKSDIIRIGVGSPGPLNTREGVIYENSNLPWKNVPIVETLQNKTGLSVKLENDANAAALGEKFFGAGKNVDNLIYVTISTGIGGGVIIDNRIYHGASDGAGEIGHMTIKPDGPLCGCGNYGCFEAVASGTAIGRMGREAVVNNQSDLMEKLCAGKYNNVDAALVAEAAYEGDRMALEIYRKAGKYLGLGLANLVNLFNPEKILLGGGVMNSWDLFREAMISSLEERSLKASLEVLDICPAALGSNTGVKGAIAVAMEEEYLQ